MDVIWHDHECPELITAAIEVEQCINHDPEILWVSEQACPATAV